MNSVEVQSGYAAFKPRARLLKLIGSELISDDVVAVTELVKNAHDADATEVILRFRGVTRPGGCVVISDDGHGMDRDTLLGGWMEPASSQKRGEHRKRSPKGRWMLGEKGLGRFAADKLGQHLELLSRRAGSAAEVRAVFDWDRFDTDTAMLREVKNRWEIRPAKELRRPGTILRISGLRSIWTERMFRRLSMRLSRLRSPFQSLHSFSIRIESDEFPEYSRELTARFLDEAPYRIDARFSPQRGFEISLNRERPRRVTWSGPALACGPLRVRIHSFDLETEAIARIGPRVEVRAWLREWSGISVYRDGFRVWPYGEPHDDWLRLDHRRVNNPVVCLSNNQVVGFVEISQKDNPELRDQTNHEGLIHNQAFEDLRRLMHFVLQQLEVERQSIRHPEGRQDRSRDRLSARAHPRDNQDLEKLRTIGVNLGGRVGAELRGIASRLDETGKRREVEQRRLIESYSHLAARGQAMLGLGPETKLLESRVRSALRNLRSQLSSVTALSPHLCTLEESVAQLDGQMALISALSEGHSRRRRSIEVPVELRKTLRLLSHRLAARGVQTHVHVQKDGLLRVEMAPESLRLLLYILTQNALDWFHTTPCPSVNISVSGQPGTVEILFSDNGPGLAPGVQDRIFEPAFSLKEGGEGMGLTLARHIVASHGGTIHALSDRRRNGATFLVVLPRRRSRAT